MLFVCTFLMCFKVWQEGSSKKNPLTQLWFNSSAYGIDAPIFWEFKEDGSLDLTTGRNEISTHNWKIYNHNNLFIKEFGKKRIIETLSEDSLILNEGNRRIILLSNNFFAKKNKKKLNINVLSNSIWASNELYEKLYNKDYYSKYYFLPDKVIHDKFINQNNSYFVSMYKNLIVKKDIIFIGFQGIRDFLMTVSDIDEKRLSVKLWEDGESYEIAFDKKYDTSILSSTKEIEGIWKVDEALPKQIDPVKSITPIPKKIAFQENEYTLYFEGGFYEKGKYKIGADNELILLINESTPYRHFMRLLSLTEKEIILKLGQKFPDYDEIIKYKRIKK